MSKTSRIVAFTLLLLTTSACGESATDVEIPADLLGSWVATSLVWGGTDLVAGGTTLNLTFSDDGTFSGASTQSPTNLFL